MRWSRQIGALARQANRSLSTHTTVGWFVSRSTGLAPMALSAQKDAVRTFTTSPQSRNEETHQDFQPKVKKGGVDQSRIESMVNDDLRGNRIMVYMKGHPEAPMCGFSNLVCRVLDAYGQEYGHRNVLEDQELREGIKQYTDWPTIPQVFVNGEFIGGSDIIMSMHQNGELSEVLTESKQ